MTSRPEETVFESQLSNGLQVLLREDHTAPIATFWTWYRVGSRNELPGKTGISHWVEHMQFKGTPSIAKGQIFRDVSSAGGTLNALTSHDWTAYFETVPVVFKTEQRNFSAAESRDGGAENPNCARANNHDPVAGTQR